MFILNTSKQILANIKKANHTILKRKLQYLKKWTAAKHSGYKILLSQKKINHIKQFLKTV